MSRKVADCRDYPSETGCTLTISGEEDEVLNAACQHAVAVHGEKDTAELREMIRGGLKDESELEEARSVPPYATPAPPPH